MQVGSCLGGCHHRGHTGGGQTGEEEAREHQARGSSSQCISYILIAAVWSQGRTGRRAEDEPWLLFHALNFQAPLSFLPPTSFCSDRATHTVAPRLLSLSRSVPSWLFSKSLESFLKEEKREQGLHGGKTPCNTFLHLPPPPLSCLLSIPPFSSAGTCRK